MGLRQLRLISDHDLRVNGALDIGTGVALCGDGGFALLQISHACIQIRRRVRV